MRRLASVKDAFLDLLFPKLCLGCGSEGVFLCVSCRASLRGIWPQCVVCRALVPPRGRIPAGRTCLACRRRSAVFTFLSPFSYDDPVVRELIHGLKYRRLRSLAPILAELLAEYVAHFGIVLPAQGLIVPVPLHPTRERVRGFNQSELIAREFGPRAGLPVSPTLLSKVRDTRAQAELSAEDRRQNLVGAFRAPEPQLVHGRIVILLDDVKTTGATLEEAARTLRRAGAKQVWAITVAH